MSLLNVFSRTEPEAVTPTETKKTKLLIGVAGFHGVIPEAQENFFQLAYRLGKDNPDMDCYLKVIIKREQFRARNNLVDLALINQVDYLLMLDDDMIVPTDLVKRLMAHDKDICGALYYQRGGAYHPVIMKQFNKKDGLKGVDFIHHFDPIIVNRGLHRLKQGVIGGGCMLIKREVLERLPQPVFWIDGIVGTDVHFCAQAEESGFEVWVDTSLELGHIGEAKTITSRTIPHYGRELGRISQQLWEDLRGYYVVDDMQLESMVTQAASGQARADHWNSEPRDTWEQVRAYYQDDGQWPVLNLSAYNLRFDQARDWAINELPKALKAGDRVIDYGCGVGYVDVPLGEKGFPVEAIDLAKTQTMKFLQWRIQRHGLQDVITPHEFEGPVPEDLPVKAKAVLMISVLDHAWDPYGALAWAYRHLEPGGYLLCDSWRTIPKEDEPQHLIKFDPHKFLSYMRSQGWRELPDNPFLFQKE